jgi:hypothetical protein
MLLAACEATNLSERVLAVAIALAIVVFWFGMAWLVTWLDREPEERWALLAILIVAGGATAAVVTGLHANLEDLFLPGVVVLLAPRGAGGVLPRVGAPRGIGAAFTGAAFLPLAVIVVLILATYLGGTCIGEELG